MLSNNDINMQNQAIIIFYMKVLEFCISLEASIGDQISLLKFDD